MMTLKEFCDYVKEHLPDSLPGEYEGASIEFNRTLKNNGLTLQGLSIRKEGKSIAPNLYMEKYYDMYESGYGLQSVVDAIAGDYVKYDINDVEKNMFQIPSNVYDYEAVKDKLVVNVVNTWRNNDRFEMIPHVEKEDLSCIFKIVVVSDKDHKATITVNNAMLQAWGISSEQLYKEAMANMQRIDPPFMQSMHSVLSSFGVLPDDDIPEERMMYIISNDSKMGGAVYMFSDELLSGLAEKINSDLIILPSSIHEVIAISAEFDHIEELEEMVRSINSTQVEPEEQLSDNVYYYDAKEHELTLASEHEERVKAESRAEEKPVEAEELSCDQVMSVKGRR